MKTWQRLALGGAGLAVGGAVTYFFVRSVVDKSALDAVLAERPAGFQPKVLYRERADGVRPEMQGLLDAWLAEGTHDILVAVDGGTRTDPAKQLAFFNAGLSKARTLDETPHGHGAALDIYPVGFNPALTLAQQPGMADRLRAFGVFAERRGFVWGGRWTNLFADGDQPHVEMKSWHSLPLIAPASFSGFRLAAA